jgi:hypothetical protein
VILKFVSHVIGKQGATIQSMKRDTGAHISIVSLDDTYMQPTRSYLAFLGVFLLTGRCAVIFGTLDQTCAAQAAIFEIILRNIAKSMRSPPAPMFMVPVPSCFTPHVCSHRMLRISTSTHSVSRLYQVHLFSHFLTNSTLMQRLCFTIIRFQSARSFKVHEYFSSHLQQAHG